ncbi:acyltransferase [Desulfovibrio mangrovi]|uniref:acyltransferase n=1 Tax=Desulfovibrio mangrovi TaxID=2976983 RepID=UPI0023DEB890|nr:acyltransferase [Desulfovibrio mangrovi]
MSCRIIVNKIYNVFKILYIWTSSGVCKNMLKLYGVCFEGAAIFDGYPQIRLANTASLRVGDKCIFRSTSFVNSIGCRRCFINVAEGATLTFGREVGVSGIQIGCASNISIGDGTIVGSNVIITDCDWHSVSPSDRRANRFNTIKNSQPVVIRENVWVGMNAVILKGVSIGENSVIGAGAVVTKDVPPNSIAYGNPLTVRPLPMEGE